MYSMEVALLQYVLHVCNRNWTDTITNACVNMHGCDRTASLPLQTHVYVRAAPIAHPVVWIVCNFHAQTVHEL